MAAQQHGPGAQPDRLAGERSALAQADWQYVEKTRLDTFSEHDWQTLNAQRDPYLGDERARQALAMLTAQKSSPSFGYLINNYEHCLQAATMAMQAGEDEETVVVALFHDLGFITCNETHGDFAAQLLKPYVSERNIWMLERHMYFQAVHCSSHPDCDAKVQERWRGHEYYEYTARWVRDYDIPSIDSSLENYPLSAFEPLVYRIFEKPKNPIYFPP